MPMKYILSGNPADVEKVVKENSIRVARGVIKFTPVTATENAPEEPAVADTKEEPSDDSKEAPVADTKSPKRKTKE